MRPTSVALAPGSRLGAYEIVSLLGEGGMGQVYRAKDTRLKRDVALKILPESFALDRESKRVAFEAHAGHLRFLPTMIIALVVVGWLLSAHLGAVTTFDLTNASIADIRTAFEAGALTSERLTQLFLARIDAYDKKGPHLNAVLRINPHALDDARALDAERRTTGPRGPLHGIPVLLKDNIDAVGMPTSAGFYALRDSMPAQDAEQTRRLRAAGCVILGKTNMSEFATGPAISTLGGQILNPWSLDRTPAGSSGGNGAGLAAGFAVFALGTDTGGSIRAPSAANGIVGLKPTFGLTGRGGIIPLALSLDTVGPMARHVSDLAAVLNVMVGPDPRDHDVVAHERVDYTAALRPTALRGARLGLLRDYMKFDPTTDAVIETAVAVLRNQGAEVIDISLPRFVLGLNIEAYETIRDTEFRYQIEDYLRSLTRTDLPKTHADIIRLSENITNVTAEGWVPNKARLEAYKREAQAGTLQDQPYRSALTDGRKMVRESLEWFLAKERLDAFIGPTARPPRLIKDEATLPPPTLGGNWPRLANMSGWPDLVVPAGFTSNPVLPVTLSFLGPAFSEAKLLGYGNAFEHALAVRRLPGTTPPLSGEHFDY
jgi:amidase